MEYRLEARVNFVWTVPAEVVEVYDGDTVRLILDLGWNVKYGPALCRLRGIDAPELHAEGGKASRDYARTLCPHGGTVTFVSHELGKFGRPLGDVTLSDGTDMGTVMKEAGHADQYGGM